MAITGQKVASIMKKNAIPRGKWNASGRVKGWGSWLSGVRVEAIQQWDDKAGGMMRGKNGWQRNYDGTPRYKGAYRNTGSWTMDWCSGDRDRVDDRGHLQRAVEAFRAAGCTVTDNGNGTYTVS